MIIGWDEPKRIANLDKHGLDFASVDLDFFAGAVVLPAKKGRFKAVGHLAGVLTVVVIFAALGQEAISIISLRRAKAKERSLFDG
jgi:uncharacterized DUF497 family protein